MAGPFARILANIIVMGASVASRAFMQAYQQAVANAKSGKTVTQAASSAVSRRKIMSREQAKEILNFEQNSKPSAQEIEQRFSKYFEANDPAKGGSFYLQSKIYRAKEALERIEKEENEKKDS